MKWICSDPQVHKTFMLIVSNNANVMESRKKSAKTVKEWDRTGGVRMRDGNKKDAMRCMKREFMFTVIGGFDCFLLCIASNHTVNDINILFRFAILFVPQSYIICSAPTFVKCAFRLIQSFGGRIHLWPARFICTTVISANKRIYVWLPE